MNFRHFFESVEGISGVWYHGTDITSAKIILKDQYLRPRQETKQQGVKGLPQSISTNVYLTKNVNVAIHASYYKARSYEFGDGAYLFTVTSKDLSEVKADEDFPYFIITNNKIADNIPNVIQEKIRKLFSKYLSKQEMKMINQPNLIEKLMNISKIIINQLSSEDHIAIINSTQGLAHIGKIPYSECWYIPWVIQPSPNYIHANAVVKKPEDLERYGKQIK